MATDIKTGVNPESITPPGGIIDVEKLREKAEKTTGKGRPSKEAKEAKQILETVEISGEIFAPIYTAISSALASKFGGEVALTKDEVGSLSYYTALVVKNHLPAAIDKYGAEVALIGLIGTTGANKYFRYKAANKNKKQDKKQDKKPENG